jgi:hypothetical protein
MVTPLQENARDLERELAWLAAVLDARLRLYFGQEVQVASVRDLPPPDLAGSTSPYALFVRGAELSFAERLVLVLALVPVLRPQLLDVLWSRNEATGRGFTEFGGAQGIAHGGFIPTGETAAFLLAGEDLADRFEVARMFEGGHLFSRQNVLQVSGVGPGEPALGGALAVSREHRQRFTAGHDASPHFNSEFPARRIVTDLGWDHLVLPSAAMEQLDEIKQWILHGDRLLHEWEMGLKLKPGFTSLFHGPPGTGKTLSACLLGKHCSRDVYRIDLSMVASKYIGDTEKNLAKVFDMAEHKGWILFFDEADALFGKRTNVDDARDRYANQEVSFLLQRIEDFHGVVILTSNLKSNIDEAFMRRFHSVINFPMPKATERLRIWRGAFSSKATLEESLDLEDIARRHDIAGGTIMNVVRHASLKALSRGSNVILLGDVETGIRRELQKEGRAM